MITKHLFINYLHRSLAITGIVSLGITLSCCVCVHRAAYVTAHHVSLSSVLYPVFCSVFFSLYV